MRSWKLLLPLLAPSLCFAVQLDRVTGPIDSSQRIAVRGNVHGLAQSRLDLGRADGSELIRGITLAFRPSAAQQKDLDNLLAQQQDRSSPKYHKWLTPAQFADRFGMTPADINRVTAWLESQGFTVTSVANSRNQISLDGTVAQIESAFGTEIHDYLVDGEIHFANATVPSVPAAIAAVVLSVGHLHNFSPRPRAKLRATLSSEADPHFTSHISGNHFLTPGDFATIYDVVPVYNAGIDGTGQTVAIIGQSSVNLTDIGTFRSNAGLAARAPQLVLAPSSSTSARCAGDELESDLDLEWSGGVAKNANVILVYAGLVGTDTCTLRNNNVWNALQQAIDTNVAPVISISYGFCESGLGNPFSNEVRGWAQQANAQGQTVIASSGDSGAADCDPNNTDPNGTSATGGLAVDIPAAIPEVTGMGGTEFSGDPGTCPNSTCTGDAPPDLPYWSGTTGGTDAISSALVYIPEMAWNDTVANASLSASGGGASIYFTKQAGEASWQVGTGVPNDGKRDVPDLALSASPDHDPYLICSEDGANGAIAATCTSGFRTGSGGNLTAVGGTSVAAPTFAGIVALLNQQLGSLGLGNINPSLYGLAATSPAVFHDVTTGNNIVPCSQGTTDCTTAPFQYGFTISGSGYDQVTGLGSVDVNALFTAWPSSRTGSTVTISSSANNVFQGTSVTFTVAVTPSTSVGTVSLSTLNNGSTTALGTVTLNIPYPPSTSGTATFTTKSLPGGSNSVTATYEGDAAHGPSTSAATAVTVVVPFTLLASPSSLNVPAGQTATSTITVTPTGGPPGGTVTFTNSTPSTPGSCTTGLPAGAFCSFNPTTVSLGSSPQPVLLTITTAANMALPSGAQVITVTGSGTGSIAGTTSTTPVNLTVTQTNQSFTLASTNGATFFPVAVGGSASVSITATGTGAPISFVNTTTNTTSLPLTYTCSGTPSFATAEISCQLPNNGQPDSAAAVTLKLATTPVTAQLLRPVLGPGRRIFFAMLLPGLFGLVFAVGSRTRSLRLLGLIVVLGFSTLWLGACGGNNGNTSLKNPGTPPGTYAVTINATTGGANPITSSLQITLSVTP